MDTALIPAPVLAEARPDEPRLWPGIRVQASSARARLAGISLLLLAIIVLAGMVGQRLMSTPASASTRRAEPTVNVPSPLAVAAMAPDQVVADLDPAAAIVINGSRPVDGQPEGVHPFRPNYEAEDRARAIECLAAAAWYEAGDDPAGESAVIQVVLNRARHPSYPKTVCGVVFQGSERRTGCQFTFTCDGSMARIASAAAWQRARALAAAALDGSVDTSVGAATHYHADYVVPYWASSLHKLSQIGRHIFYRFRGAAGSVQNLASRGGGKEPSIPLVARYSNAHVGQPSVEQAALVEQPDGIAGAEPATAAAQTALPPVATNAILTSFDSAAPAGRWAVEARTRCLGQDDCQFIAWASADQLERNRTRRATDRDRPLFVFIRDRASGMEIAQWDCVSAPRSNPRQCLPTERLAVERLTRERT